MTSTVDLPHARGDVPAELAAALGSLVEALDAVLAVEPHAHGAAAAHVAGILGSVASRAAVGQARLLPVIEADGRWALAGHRSLVQWAAANLRLPVSCARAQVRLGRALRDHLPETADAATLGEIGHEAAHVLAALAPTTQARRAVLADREHECNESFLVEQARSLRVDDLRRLTRAWACRADPDADDRGFVEASEREHLELARLPFGYRVEGQLTVEHGQQLQTALAAVMGVPASTDGRSTTQRRAQGLADLARLALDHGLVGTGNAIRPQVTVHIDHTTFRRLVAPRHRRLRRRSHPRRCDASRASRTAPPSRAPCWTGSRATAGGTGSSSAHGQRSSTPGARPARTRAPAGQPWSPATATASTRAAPHRPR